MTHRAAHLANRISIGALISELFYRAAALPSFFEGQPKDFETEAYLFTNPTKEQLAALVANEMSGKAEGRLVRLRVRVEIQLRRLEQIPPVGTAFERSLIEAFRFLVAHLHPWDAPGISEKSIAYLNVEGERLKEPIELGPGIIATYGSTEEATQMQVYLSPLDPRWAANGQRRLSIDLILSAEACSSLGIRDATTLLATNGRRSLGRYVDLAALPGGDPVGELNARVKRELSRMLIRLGGTKAPETAR